MSTTNEQAPLLNSPNSVELADLDEDEEDVMQNRRKKGEEIETEMREESVRVVAPRNDICSSSSIYLLLHNKLMDEDDPDKTDLYYYDAGEDDGSTIVDPNGPRDMTKVLPARIVMQIMLQLEPADLCAMACVSKRWKRVADNHRVWKDMCLRKLAPSMPVEDICVDNRDYKQLLKTEWLIRKWKHSHAPRAPLQSEEEQAKEDYKQLNFLFEEKMLDLKDMVSYNVVLLLRMFNSPIVDYATFALLLAATLLIGLRLDEIISWSWGLVFLPLWCFILIFFGSTTTWFFFVARGLMDKEFMQRCLFGWINVLCCCFSDDKTESGLWYGGALGITVWPVLLVFYLEDVLPLEWPGSPFIVFLPLMGTTILLAALSIRSIIIRQSNAKGVKTLFVACCLLACLFFFFIAMRAAVMVEWTVWQVGSPIWAGYCLIFVSALSACDPLFFRQNNWIKNGLIMASLVTLMMSPCFVQQLLLSLCISGDREMSYCVALIPAFIFTTGALVLLIFADCHLWQRTKHFWVFKRSFKGPLKEHWRRPDSVIVIN